MTKLQNALRKNFGGSIIVDQIVDVYFKLNYDPFETLIYFIKNPNVIKYAARDSFSPLEKNLFETGMRVFGKKYRKIAGLIKSKSLEEVMTYYYFWKTTSRYELFYKRLKEEVFETTDVLRSRRRKIYILKLKALKKDPKLTKVYVRIPPLPPGLDDPTASYIRNPPKSSSTPVDSKNGTTSRNTLSPHKHVKLK